MSFASLRAKAEAASASSWEKAKGLGAHHGDSAHTGASPQVNENASPTASRALPPRASATGGASTAHRQTRRASPAASHDASRFIGYGVDGKERFFALLDEYFARRGKHRITHARSSPAPPTSAASKSISTVHDTTESNPPALHHWARPSLPSVTSSSDLVLSHPPTAQRSCSAEDAAADLALYQQAEAWWENQPPQPPGLKGRSDTMWTMSGQFTGSSKTLFGTALFSDLSSLWYRVQSRTGSRNVADAHLEALYAGRPGPLDFENAEWAAEVFNESVARFAEQAEASRLPVGDGECWTLAAEALNSIDPGLPNHVPSISRTHGSLVYEGRATGKGRANQMGRWRGGDKRIRRGDIVEWRRVTITFAGGWSSLGNPDHTAVIIRDAVPAADVYDGQSVPPMELGSLTVIEQSAGKMPTRATYQLDGLSAGEMWIYRPCAYEQLGLPSNFAATWPPPVPALKPQ